MKSKAKKREIRILPESTGLAIAMLVAGLSELLFLALVMALDVLPLKYLALGTLLLLAIDVLIVFLATSLSKHGTRRIGCLVIIFVVLITLLGGDYYIFSTNDTLSKISQQRDTWEYYDVLVNADSSYEKVGDIKGHTVFVTDMDSKQLKEAKERLVTKADVEYIKEPNFVAVGEHILNRDVKEEEISAVEDAADASKNVDKSEAAAKEVSDEVTLSDTDVDKTAESASTDEVNVSAEEAIILVSQSQYKMLKANVKGFKKATRCIYRIKVKERANDNSKAVNVTEDSFNVLISGLDSWGTIDQGGLSDVNMVMTVNPTTREVLLTSIPRDSYIPLHSYGAKDKLTHSGIYGEEETKATIEDFLDIDINYTIRVNFSMLCDIIDAIGGVRVYNDVDFYSSVKHWHYKKGWHNMEGHYALWFARERKSFLEGDMKRNENQQKVMEALLKKVTSSKVILTRYTSILNAVEDEMATDMTDKDLKALVKMQLSDMKKWNIEKVNIKGTTGGAPCYSMGGQTLSCVFPDEQTVSDTKEMIHNIMYPVDNTKTKKQQEKEKKEKEKKKQESESGE
ncbi:MAG: LCP family protein [Clostridia bacterium]|nr:LCP family protein [Clostridia bacterium]